MSSWDWPNSTITRVVDGDTVDALVSRDLGFGGSARFTVRLRLHRINTPPISTTDGQTAREYVAAHTLGQSLLIVTGKPYKYGGPDNSPGEWMAEVTLPDGANLSDSLVTDGHAYYWDGQGPRPGG